MLHVHRGLEWGLDEVAPLPCLADPRRGQCWGAWTPESEILLSSELPHAIPRTHTHFLLSPTRKGGARPGVASPSLSLGCLCDSNRPNGAVYAL